MGRWGEELVFNMLRRALAVTEMRVNWVNEAGERFMPWDLELIRIDSPSNNAVDTYIEVKSSASLEKPFFEVSIAELEHARASASRYVIFRVVGVGSAGGAGVRVAALRDPLRHLQPGGSLSLLLATRVLTVGN